MPKVIHLRSIKLTLGQLDIQLILLESSKDFTYMLDIILLILGENQDIIQIYHTGNIQEIS